MKPKLTPLFPSYKKPIRIGVYRTFYYGTGGYSYWNGTHWGWEMTTIKKADGYRNTNSASQEKSWRGLAEDPAKAAP